MTWTSRSSTRFAHATARLRGSRLFALFLFGVAALSVRAALVNADDARRAWGTTVQVVTATRALREGTLVSADDVEVRSLPAVAVPPDALDGLAAVLGQRVDEPVHRGEIMLGAAVGNHRSALAARLPPGTRGVALPTGRVRAAVVVGDRVDVVIVAPDGSAASVDAATVIDADEDQVTVAVAESDSKRIAGAALSGAAAVLIR